VTGDAGASPYRFGYDEDGVYGRAVALVLAHGRPDGVHLDLGCGFGAIAEPLRDAGRSYLGADRHPEGLEDLAGRGFETVAVDLQDVATTTRTLRAALAGRPLASVTLLDVLEHVTSGPALLDALRALAAPSAAPLVVSVPNVAHRDVALKLMAGRFDLTETGLLDRTHVVHHTASLLAERMASAGWQEVGAYDLRLERSDQYFPADLATLSPAASVHRYLLSLRGDEHATTNQFVRAYQPGPGPGRATVTDPRAEPEGRPFLSVVLRTQGTRPETFRDALLCLQGQTLPDFEVLVAVHKAAAEAQADVEHAVAELPGAMRSRVRVLTVPGGGRARPLNDAFAVACGRYVAVLDDDDLVLAHWVEAFADAAAHAPGSVLRAVCVEQPMEPSRWGEDRRGVLVTGAMTQPYPQSFDLIDHMARNHTPFMAYAFPLALFRDLGLRFDETLDICEDWDYSLRAALLAGVTSVPSVTAVYRRWETGRSSSSLHVAEEWRRAEQSILDKLDGEPHVFPVGTIGAIREATTRAERRVARDLAALKERNTELEEHALRMERSASWRLTAPLRAIRNRGRRRP
jgi:GT2 family glycosyltransferase